MSQKYYLKLLPEHAEIFNRLSDIEVVILIRYTMQYLEKQDIAPLGNPLLGMAFAALKVGMHPVDGRSATSSINGRLGGRPKTKKPKSCLGFCDEKNEKIASPPNSKIIIKEELFNRGNTQSDNISSYEDNYLPSSTENNIIPPKKEEGIINYPSQEKGVPEIEERPDEKGEARKKTSKESIDFNALLAYFNSRMAQCAIKPISRMTERRKDAVGARMREYGKEAIQTAIDNAAASDLMNGRNNRGWVATFDWIFLPNNFPKVLEGNYENKTISYEDKEELAHRRRLDRHAGVVQRLLDEASRDPDALVNRLKAAGDVQRVPDDGNNGES